MRWKLAEATGWTLEYIDGLSIGDVNEYLNVKDAQSRWQKSEARKHASSHRKSKR